MYTRCCSKWQESSREELIAQLGISLNNKYCDGDYLITLVDFARSHFSSIHFLVGDTLHRYNYRVSPEVPEAEAYKKSLLRGDIWLERDLQLVDSVLEKSQYKVVRWDEWLKYPLFKDYCQKFQDLYQADDIFQRTVDKDVLGFIDRRKKAGNKFQDEAFCHAMGVQFIIEELAVYAVANELYNFVLIYPGTQLKSLRLSLKHHSMPPSLKSRHYHYVQFRD